MLEGLKLASITCAFKRTVNLWEFQPTYTSSMSCPERKHKPILRIMLFSEADVLTVDENGYGIRLVWAVLIVILASEQVRGRQKSVGLNLRSPWIKDRYQNTQAKQRRAGNTVLLKVKAIALICSRYIWKGLHAVRRKSSKKHRCHHHFDSSEEVFSLTKYVQNWKTAVPSYFCVDTQT